MTLIFVRWRKPRAGGVEPLLVVNRGRKTVCRRVSEVGLVAPHRGAAGARVARVERTTANAIVAHHSRVARDPKGLEVDRGATTTFVMTAIPIDVMERRSQIL